MAFPISPELPPLREDPAGVLRVGTSRVLLELVIRAFQDGATPETIVQRYPTLALGDVDAVIAYYLRHASEIDQYLARREHDAAAAQQRAQFTEGELGAIRARLSARRTA